MERRVEYHLARARAAASAAAPGTRCDVSASIEPLARTLRRLYAERVELTTGQTHLAVAVERQDLDEMVGISSTTPASGRAGARASGRATTGTGASSSS